MRLGKKSVWLFIGITCLGVIAYVIVTREAFRPAKEPIRISPETTYIDGPLDEDGYVDYAAAVNARYGAGVTPANNIVVTIYAATGAGPSEIASEFRDEYFRQLGAPRPPDVGDYLMTTYAFSPGRPGAPDNALADQAAIAMSRPWSSQDFPRVAAWLKANERPLDRLVEGATRTRYYSPIVGPKDGARMFGCLLPAAVAARRLADALAARVMLRVGSGQIEGAWRDALACHRLARLVGQGPTSIECRVCCVIDTIADRVDIAIAGSDKLTATQARRHSAELRGLSALPDLGEKLGYADRFELLDMVTDFAHRGTRTPPGLLQGRIDWHVTLTLANEWYDRVADAARKPTHQERRKAVATWRASLLAMARDAETGEKSSARLLPAWNSQWIAKLSVSLALSGVSEAFRIRDSAAERLEIVQLAFALAAFRADHGSYPKNLAELAPQYIASVPKDMFTGGGLHYKPSKKGYLLYSVGPNEKDDGGADFDSDPPGDDITARVPLPPAK